MKRIALAFAALLFVTLSATVPTTATAASSSAPAPDVARFTAQSYTLSADTKVAYITYYDTFSCYQGFEHKVGTLHGATVVYLEARPLPEGYLCVQVLSKMTIAVDLSRVAKKTGLLGWNLQPIPMRGIGG